MEIRELRPDDHGDWLQLRHLLWPDTSHEELSREQAEILADPARNAVFVAAAPDGDLAGFVEVAIRDWADGCDTRPVGYIEGWFVRPDHHCQGIGRRLIDAAERWALSRGCQEMGSDAELHNDASHNAHRALGYNEVTRLVLYAKKLEP